MSKPINKFWKFVAANAAKGQPAELILYGEISTYSWWGDEITPKQFSDDLNALGDVTEIVVRINSGGGDVFAANAIYTRLKGHKAKITVKIDGWAASSATIVAMAGDVIQIPANGVFMIHNPQMGVIGYFEETEFIKLSEELAVIKQAIIMGYALKTGLDEAEISELMSNETWYDGKQAVESGFCDEIMFGEVKTEIENASRVVVNSVPFDINRYPNIPAALLNSRAPGGGLTNKNPTNQKNKEVNNNMEPKNVEELVAAYPGLAAQVADKAAADERKRIMDIDAIAPAGYEAIANKAKFETPISAAEVAMSILAEQKKQGSKHITDTDADVQDSGINKVKPAGHEGGGDKKGPYDAAIDKAFPEPK